MEGQPARERYTVCAQHGCPELVPYWEGVDLTAERYCPKHRVLFELDQLDGSTEDTLEEPD